MHAPIQSLFGLFVVLAFNSVAIAQSADAEGAALDLMSAPAQDAAAVRTTKLFLEGAVGSASQRYESGSRDLGRVSLDLSYSGSVGPGLRATMSSRLDHLYPTEVGADATVNSLREAYLSWQPEGGNTVLEFGRINVRNGPGYGFNPADFFRDGTLRTLTTANPFAQRENRLGSVMLRGQQYWSGGSLSVALSPKLAGARSTDGWSLDLGATNHRNRALVALGTQYSQRVSGQVLIYKEQDMQATLGASLTALLSDAAVAHAEASRGSEPDLLSRTSGLPGANSTRNRFAGGVTYTTLGKLSVTAEYQYNGFALDQNGWTALGANPSNQVAYQIEAQRLQEIVPRQAYLVYVRQKSLFIKELDLTAFLRINANDHSRLTWLELRNHWSRFDLAVQFQQHVGGPSSEYGVLPDRRVIQVLASYYF